jgi:hypothetical protein
MIHAFQWDLARQVEKLDWLLAQLPKYAEWGYQELHLHLEDAVDYPSLPGVARRDAFSWRQFARLVEAAGQNGIKVVPIANLLGHTQYLIKTEEWRDLNELRADDGSPLPVGQICPSHPRSREVAEKLISDLAPFCTAGKIHVGLDESFHLGKHPASRPLIESIGLARYFAEYVNELHGIAGGHGLRTAIWADMLVVLPEAIAHLPKGLIAYDWYYHAFTRHPRFELFNYRTYDMVPSLKAQGIKYWGCPMNGAFRFEPLPVFGERLANAQSWWKRCQTTGAEGFLVTGWEPNRLAIETTQIVDAAIAGLWLDSGPHDQVGLLQRGFERVYGKRHAAALSRLMLAADERAYAGYAKWDINQRWDTIQGRPEAEKYQAERRFFERAISPRLPLALIASFRWRAYLATKDHFVRNTHHQINRARRLSNRDRQKELNTLIRKMKRDAADFLKAVRIGQEAADSMWKLSRRTKTDHPNSNQIKTDLRLLQKWRQWMTEVASDPTQLFTQSPFGGRWQFYAIVHTVRPAQQQIVVQILEADGVWRDQHQRYLIEFRTKAARPRTNIRHWLSLPVDSPDIKLRLICRGTGELAVSDVHLSNGIVEYRTAKDALHRSKKISLGRFDGAQIKSQIDRSHDLESQEITWGHPPTDRT